MILKFILRNFKKSKLRTLLVLISVVNVYGPTENTTFTTYYEYESEKEIVPIGKAITNTQVYIMRDNKMCGVGVPGELCCAGDGVSTGYYLRADITAEKFIDMYNHGSHFWSSM